MGTGVGGDRETEDRPLFVTHVMKTGGLSLRDEVRRNLDVDELYPDHGPGHRRKPTSMWRYWDIASLLALPEEERRTIRAYVGHWPLVVADLLPEDLVTMAVLRDPVERTLSYLRMRTRDPERRGMSAVEVYEHAFDHPCFIRDHQTKMLAMTAEDELETFMDVIRLDAGRLELAKARLDAVSIVGLHEHLDEAVTLLRRRYRWPHRPFPRTNVSPGAIDVPDGFRERIAEDNALDVELYRFAVDLHRRRAAAEGDASQPPDARDGSQTTSGTPWAGYVDPPKHHHSSE